MTNLRPGFSFFYSKDCFDWLFWFYLFPILCLLKSYWSYSSMKISSLKCSFVYIRTYSVSGYTYVCIYACMYVCMYVCNSVHPESTAFGDSQVIVYVIIRISSKYTNTYFCVKYGGKGYVVCGHDSRKDSIVYIRVFHNSLVECIIE